MNDIIKVRLFLCWSLIFSFLVSGCRESEKEPQMAIFVDVEHPKKVTVLRSLLRGTPEDSIQTHLHFHIAESGAPPILGDYTITEDSVTFEPLIGFTPGVRYEIRLGDLLIGEFFLAAPVGKAPVVMNFYPAVDTVPENLLKVYIRFSQPMQEGFSSKNIRFEENGKTLENVFLDLNHELWSPDRSMLTLWLDPGRIKRDLQPNQLLGAPLKAGSTYQLIVSKWPDNHGRKMEDDGIMPFTVTARDTLSPDPDKWTIHLPKAASKEPVVLELHESLDFMLLNEALRVVDDRGKPVAGAIRTGEGERTWAFTPDNNWLAGAYIIEIESRLEDLAGNNLNRLFDNDLSKPQKKNPQDVYKKTFQVR